MRVKNLAPIVTNYLAEGVHFFVLAVSIRDRSEGRSPPGRDYAVRALGPSGKSSHPQLPVNA
jgi:hypothetical protein